MIFFLEENKVIDRIKLYLKMMRLTHQSTAIVALFFGSLDAHFYNLTVIIPVAVGFFFVSVSSFVINEFIDAKDTDKFSKRDRPLASITVSKKLTFLIWATTGVTGTIILFYYGLYWQAVLSLLAGLAYSIPPIRLKARFPYDQLTVFFYLIFVPYSLDDCDWFS